MRLEDAIQQTFRTMGKDVVHEPEKLCGCIMDLCDDGSIEYVVLINNCDSEFLGQFASALEANSYSVLESASRRAQDVLVRNRAVDVNVARRICSTVSKALADEMKLFPGVNSGQMNQSTDSASKRLGTQTAAQSATTFCMYCGAEIEADAVFCTKCGHSLGDSQDVEQGQKKEHMPKAVYWITVACAIAIVAFVAIVVVMLVLGSQTPANHTESGVDAIAIDETEQSTSVDGESSASGNELTSDTENPPTSGENDSLQGAVPPNFTDVVSSSTLEPDQYTSYYGPYNARDKDLLTAWNEGAPNDGSGEWIRLEASMDQVVKKIEIVGGYTKSEEIYYRNNRPKDITITLSDGYSMQAILSDSFGEWQTIDLDTAHNTSFVQIQIDSVYPGNKWNDAAIAEIEVR